MDENILEDLEFVKSLGGTEDLMFGFGTVTQIREGKSVIISKINADTIPYDSTYSVKEVLDKLMDKIEIAL